VGAGAIWRTTRTEPTDLSLGELLERVEAGKVRSATLTGDDRGVKGTLSDGTSYTATVPKEYVDELTERLRAAEAPIELDADKPGSRIWSDLVLTMLPLSLLVVAFVVILNRYSGNGKANLFGRAKPARGRGLGTVLFSDVAGADEAVEELQEIADFLAEPARFRNLGAKIPKGVLLFGPPGTGKTLLARAVAGEADAAFFSISGSDFVEMFVGVGAARVRDLFRQAQQEAPAIIFVDEIDAVGRQRGAGLGGGHDEREQTLNQLLVEMDGFDNRSGVIVVAATNRPDILDPALLRPGRFDRHVRVDLPDRRGREAILTVHARGKPIEEGVALGPLAGRTAGMSGADLANLLNEAAILAARRRATRISRSDLDDAVERVLVGPTRRTVVLGPDERRVVAYHEAGHALLGHLLPTADEVHKVSIVARGQALGLTMTLPAQDRVLHSRARLFELMVEYLGGRTAEEMVFGEITTGASDDIAKVTDIARLMVTEYGMSEVLGPRRFGQRHGEPFLGREMAHEPDYAELTAAKIDREIDAMVAAARNLAWRLLATNRATLDRLADTLLECETVDQDALGEVFAGLNRLRPGEPVPGPQHPALARRSAVAGSAGGAGRNGARSGAGNGAATEPAAPRPADTVPESRMLAEP
jgi:cell division protease FtsH